MKLPFELESKLDVCKSRVRQLETCVKITSLLNSRLELSNLLDTIMETAKNVMKADACTLLLLEADGKNMSVEVALSDVGEKLRELAHAARIRVGEGIAGTVAKTGRAVMVKDAYKYPRFNAAYDRQTGFNTGAVLCAPLKASGEIIGVCQVIHKRESGRVFNGKDLALFKMFCESAALAIRNARSHETLLEMRRIERDMEVARSVQESFLPREAPRHERFNFAVKFLPAREVGGDYYDFIPFDDGRLGVVLGDVSGKGVPAALLMARLMSDFRYIARLHEEPEKVLRAVNANLCERAQGGMFTTAVYLTIDLRRGVVKAANAGHPSLLLRGAAGAVSQVAAAGGPPLGIAPGVNYTGEEFSLRPGERLLIYTDGVTEPRNRRNVHYGLERLCDMLAANQETLPEFVERLQQSVQRFADAGRQFDDITILAAEAV